MDVAYNQHSSHTRRHNRSSTNLNHLTLAPLTSRLPIADADDLPEPESHHVSYIEGRSAPTTPSILSRSSSRVSLKKRQAQAALPKSKSSTHLTVGKQPRQNPTSPGGTRLRQTVTREELTISSLSARDRNESDWLLRASASISTSTRESKGQAWLVSRASSTSLAGEREDQEDEFERTLASERENISRKASRRGSVATVDADDEFSPIANRRSLSFGPSTGARGQPLSRFGSRSNSRRGSRAQLFTPGAGDRDGYFDHPGSANEEFIAEPDFVDVEEEIYELESSKIDEDVVRKLARANSAGLGGWVEKMLGWSLFAVDEDGEDNEDTEQEVDESGDSSSTSTRREYISSGNTDQDITNMPPLRDEDAGGWQDAAWLLSVASRVLL